MIIHQENFIKLNQDIKNILAKNKLIIEFHAHLQTPDGLKDAMFNRIMMNGERFRLIHDFNDIICFDIINPWSDNVMAISKLLQRESCLKILYERNVDGIVYLVAATDLGTSFEIRIWPTMVYNWVRWAAKNKQISGKALMDSYRRVQHAQAQVDATHPLL